MATSGVLQAFIVSGLLCCQPYSYYIAREERSPHTADLNGEKGDFLTLLGYGRFVLLLPLWTF